MSLDISLVKDGLPDLVGAVSLIEEDHWALITAAREARLSHLEVLEDYYRELDLPWQDVQPIVGDLKLLSKNAAHHPRLASIVPALLELFKRAAEERRNVIALPD